jgi:hypothetical protein
VSLSLIAVAGAFTLHVLHLQTFKQTYIGLMLTPSFLFAVFYFGLTKCLGLHKMDAKLQNKRQVLSSGATADKASS